MTIFDTEQRSEAKVIADTLRESLDAEVVRRAGVYQHLFSLFWESDDVSPDDIIEALGTDAGLFFALSGLHCQSMAQMSALTGEPDTTPQPPRVITVNSDGTATIED